MDDLLIVSAQKRRAEDSSRDRSSNDKSVRRKLNKAITTADVQHLVIKRETFSKIDIMPKVLSKRIRSNGGEAPPRDVLEEWAQKVFHMVGRNYSKHRSCYNKLLEMLRSTKPWKGGTFKEWSSNNGFSNLMKDFEQRIVEDGEFVWTIPAAFTLAALAKNSIEFGQAMPFASPKISHYWNLGLLEFLGPAIDAFHPDVTEVFPLGRKEVTAKRLASTTSSLFYPDDPLAAIASELTETDRRKPQVVSATDFQVEHSLLIQDIGNLHQIPSQEVLRGRVFETFNADTVRLLKTDQKAKLAEWFAQMGHTQGQEWCTRSCQDYVMVLALSPDEKEQLKRLAITRLQEGNVALAMSATPADPGVITPKDASNLSALEWGNMQNPDQERGPNQGPNIEEWSKNKLLDPRLTILKPAREIPTEQKLDIMVSAQETTLNLVQSIPGTIKEKTGWLKEHRGITEPQLRDWRLLAIGARVESGSPSSLLPNTVNSLASHIGGSALVEVLNHDVDNGQSKDRKYKQLAEQWEDILE